MNPTFCRLVLKDLSLSLLKSSSVWNTLKNISTLKEYNSQSKCKYEYQKSKFSYYLFQFLSFSTFYYFSFRQKYKKTKQPQMNENILFQYKIKITSAEIIVSKHLFNFQFFPSFCFCNRQAMAAAKFNMLVTVNLKN
jgi:hypothetical protein